MALFYERINDQKKAEAEFREALRLAPGDPGQLNFYGVYLCDQHRVDEGVTKMLQVANNPLYRTPEAAYTNVGVCLHTAHRDEEAESAFRRALAARPDFAEAAYQLADLELQRGRALEARRAWSSSWRSTADTGSVAAGVARLAHAGRCAWRCAVRGDPAR